MAMTEEEFEKAIAESPSGIIRTIYKYSKSGSKFTHQMLVNKVSELEVEYSIMYDGKWSSWTKYATQLLIPDLTYLGPKPQLKRVSLVNGGIYYG